MRRFLQDDLERKERMPSAAIAANDRMAAPAWLLWVKCAPRWGTTQQKNGNESAMDQGKHSHGQRQQIDAFYAQA